MANWAIQLRTALSWNPPLPASVIGRRQDLLPFFLRHVAAISIRVMARSRQRGFVKPRWGLDARDMVTQGAPLARRPGFGMQRRWGLDARDMGTQGAPFAATATLGVWVAQSPRWPYW